MNDSVFFFVLLTSLPAAFAVFSALILKTNQTIHRNYIAELILDDLTQTLQNLDLRNTLRAVW